MNLLDQQLLARLQVSCPIVARPWAHLGAELGRDEDDVLRHVADLKARGIIRQISAIFDTKSIGYESTLVACQCDLAREAEVAAIINSHPGVSHNYHRDHAFNLWYTLAVGPTSRLGLAGTIAKLHELTGAISTRPLSTLHLFKIGVELDVTGTGRADDKRTSGYSHRYRPADAPPVNIPFVRALQQDLPLTPEPFVDIARQLGITLADLQQTAATMQAAGQLRRFSATCGIARSASAPMAWGSGPCGRRRDHSARRRTNGRLPGRHALLSTTHLSGLAL